MPTEPRSVALGEELLVESDQTIRFGSMRYFYRVNRRCVQASFYRRGQRYSVRHTEVNCPHTRSSTSVDTPAGGTHQA